MNGNRAAEANGMMWAAYVLGYDVRQLWNWHQSIWACRILAMEGRVRFDSAIGFGKDIERAVQVAADQLPGKSARRLTEWTARWKGSAERLLRDLHPKHTADSDIDWDLQCPPDLDLLLDIGRELATAIEDHPHLVRWHALGEALSVAAYGDWGLASMTAVDLRNQLSVLHLEGAYGFLPPVIGFFDRVASDEQFTQKMQAFVDPVLRVPRLQRVDAHLRRALLDCDAPTPAVEVNSRGLTFFGATIKRERFHPAEWGILVCLCRSPNKMVSIVELASAGRLTGRSPNAAPHVSRLRKILKIAMSPDVGSARYAPQARKSFIVAYPFPKGPPKYALEIDPSLVRVADDV